jgi:hypothetical protein
MVGAAFDRTDLGSLSDLDTDVLSGRALLWVVATDKIEGAGVTRLEITQHSKVCFIVAFGGHTRNMELFPAIEEYARAEGCDCVRWVGRKGWKRKLPGYREIGVVMERKV